MHHLWCEICKTPKGTRRRTFMFMTASSNGISDFFLTPFTFFLCFFVYHIYTFFFL